MNALVSSLKKFLQNKITVTIICLVLGVTTLVVGYNVRVNQAVAMTKVPYALVDIPAKTKITTKMIGHTKIPTSLLKSATNIITSDEDLIDYYSSYSTSIPKNSLFYSDVVLSQEEMPDYAFMSIEDGSTVYALKVTDKTTYFNRLRPGEYIDLYAQYEYTDSNGVRQIKIGPFIKSIKIKAVKDSKGNSLLESTVTGGTPDTLLFEVKDEYFELLKKAEYINGFTVYPVPQNAAYSKEQGSITVDATDIVDYINQNALESFE